LCFIIIIGVRAKIFFTFATRFLLQGKMVQNNSNMALCTDVRLPQAADAEMNLRNAMAPSPERRHSAVELREFQNQMIGVSLGDLAAQVIRSPANARRASEADATRRGGLTLGELRATLQFALELVSEDDF
jgi:hypothetical protein